MIIYGYILEISGQGIFHNFPSFRRSYRILGKAMTLARPHQHGNVSVAHRNVLWSNQTLVLISNPEFQTRKLPHQDLANPSGPFHNLADIHIMPSVATIVTCLSPRDSSHEVRSSSSKSLSKLG